MTRTATVADDDGPHVRLAVLIDADNAQASVIEGLLAEVARFGEATVRRIYGDFTSPNSASWKKVLARHAIKPVQQFAYTTGKNATDSMLIIDAMDLLYTRRFDGFCLVSSDSDFTGLALRLREEGLLVLGFGERKTPEAFRNACHRFVFTEVLRESRRSAIGQQRKDDGGAAADQEPGSMAPGVMAPEIPESRSPDPASSDPASSDQASPDRSSTESGDSGSASSPDAPAPFPTEFVLDALEQSSDDTGWAHLSTFGNYLVKLQPDFDSRLYGYRKLSDLVRARTDLFTVEERRDRGNRKVLYLRAK